jgi:glycosyltransferase involved in cell wall biosynthesis
VEPGSPLHRQRIGGPERPGVTGGQLRERALPRARPSRVQRVSREPVAQGRGAGELERRGARTAAYASADLFLFCSRTDTFGQVILEAQASGLPVVAVDAGGPSSLIRDATPAPVPA